MCPGAEGIEMGKNFCDSVGMVIIRLWGQVMGVNQGCRSGF